MTVEIERSGCDLSCLECGAVGCAYDTRERRWRHLSTCHSATWLVVRGAGVITGAQRAPDADDVGRVGSGVTVLFEAPVID